MIDERIRIEYAPMSPSDDRRQRQDEVAAEVEQRPSSGVLSPPGVSIPDVGNQPRPAAKMMISGMPITKYGIE